jgi:hypothetical protein
MDNMGYFTRESHIDCMVLMFLHCNLGCTKVHVYAWEFAYLSRVKDSLDVRLCDLGY